MLTTEQRTSGRTCYAQKQHDLALALISASGTVCCAKLSRGTMGRREWAQANECKQMNMRKLVQLIVGRPMWPVSTLLLASASTAVDC